ncbi:MAG: cation-translocating P-type ATPase, partial [Actinomycetia bacterium]|nr:cation-translocating P-type ATPase [Actinomycetes bacterium]
MSGKNKKNEKNLKVKVEGLDCAACALKIEKRLKGLEGINDVGVNIILKKVNVAFDPKTINEKKISKKIEQLGYKVVGAEEPEKNITLEYILLVVISIIIFFNWTKLLDSFFPFNIALIGIAVCGIPVYREAYKSIKAKNITVETFMTLAIIASAAIGEYLASLIIIFFMLIAEILEVYTQDRARAALKEITSLNPESANVLVDGREVKIKTDELKKDDEVIVRPGERIPADGVVASGASSVNQASITGESIPVDKKIGDRVYAGTLNENGAIHIKVHRAGKETTFSKIIELVEEAESAKAPVQKVADKFAAYFTPVVLSIAVLTFLISQNILYSIAVIVVACPCAIALATPLAVVASSGKAARKGIIVKGGLYLEALSKVDTFVMDKTGTLTIGKPEVTGIKTFHHHDEKEILYCAAIAEKYSEHSLAKAI